MTRDAESSARPTSGGFWAPNLIIYWADNDRPLTHQERKELELRDVQLACVTTREIIIDVHDAEEKLRKVVVRWVGDRMSPRAPPPKDPP